NWYGSAGRCGATNDVSAATGRAASPPDGGPGNREAVFLVVVVKSDTVGTGESCNGTRPITIMILVID
ncbi:hypothetical protein, partial [Pseudomonas sp. OF001]|uniref:hypothetical protein n=1 Tax=Pseudomonas sp. OF001 TaxID=2772300 RepID=UPI001F3A5323